MTILKKLSPEAEAHWYKTYGKPVVIFGQKRPPSSAKNSRTPKEKKK